MLYRKFGKTGIYVSILGFGAMRLPTKEKKGNVIIDEEYSIKIIHKCIELGINYIDTAYGYCKEESEIIVGKAIKNYRDKVYISTKSPMLRIEKRGDYRRILEEQLKKLNIDYIDFYHFHGLNWQVFQNKVLKFKLLKEALKAKEEGLIKHISFSFHDKPQYMKKIIEIGEIFETVLCQYNLIDRSNEKMIEYSVKRGLGVAVMGPVGGGRLSDFPYLMNVFKYKYKTPVEIALKFVFSNKNVSIALSGMNSIEMVEENVKIANSFYLLNNNEIKLIDKLINERKKKREIPCSGCKYCLPCPKNIPIPFIFRLFNQYVFFGSKKPIEEYKKIGEKSKDDRRKINFCIECGQCEKKCPQKIKIRKTLKKIHKIFSKNF